MTPLAKYLKKHDTTAIAVGRKMAKHLEHEPSSASLSQWVRGVTAPEAAAQLAMARATNNEVTPTDWAKWRAKTSSEDR